MSIYGVKGYSRKHLVAVSSNVFHSKQCLMFCFQIFQFGKVDPFRNMPCFLRVCITSLLKTLWKKEKLLVMSYFSLFSHCFLSFWRTLHHFHQTENCRLQTLSNWKRIRSVIWERVENFVVL